MSTKLVVRPRADVDFAEHYLFLSDRSAQAAERFFDAIYEVRDRIRRNPAGGANLCLLGFERQEFRFCRPRGFDNYLVIYRVVESTVYLVRILHGSQDLHSALSAR